MAASRTIEAKLVISGEDRVSSEIAKVVKSVRQMEDAAKVSKQMESVAKVLRDIEQASRVTDAALKARSGYAAAESGLKATQGAAHAAAQALNEARIAKAAFDGVKAAKGSEQAKQIEATTRAVREAGAAYRKVEGDMRRANAAVAAQAGSMKSAEVAAARFGADLGNLEGHQHRLRSATESATNAVRAQIRVEDQAARAATHHAREQTEAVRHMRQHGVIGAAAAAASGGLGVHSVLHVAGHALKAGAEVQGNRVDMAKAGIPFEERQHITDESLRLATTYKNVTQAGIMELWKETRSAVKDPHEVDHVIDSLVRAKSLLDAKDKSGKGSENLNLLIKGAESIGAAQDPDRLNKLIDGYMKAIQVMGKTINPEDIYLFDKYSKDAGANLSDRFLMTTAQSLTQELKGNTAGLGIAGFYKQLSGGIQNQHTAAQQLASIGLIDEKNLDRTKTGEIKGMKKGVKHGVHGDNLAATDPDLWVYNVLLPAMERHGYKNQLDQLAFVKSAFPNSNVSNTISKLITQRESFEAHAKQYGTASGTKGTDLNRSDPIAALGELTKSLETFSGVVTAPIMKDAAHGLDYLAGKVGEFSVSLDAFNKAHPDIAKAEAPVAIGAGLAGAGGASMLAYKLVTSGFGLKGSAVALDAAAVALTEAAVLQGAKGSPADLAKNAAKSGAPGSAAVAETLASRAIPALARLGGVLAPVLMLRELGEAHRPMTPEGAPYRNDQRIDPGTWERAQRGVMEFRMDPEGKRGREMMRRDAVEAEGKQAAEVVGRAIVNAPLPPQRPAMLEDFRVKAGEAGTEAGTKVGEGIRSGIETKAPEVEQQGRTLFERLKGLFAEGINLPINFAPGNGMGGGAGGGMIQKASLGGSGGSDAGGLGGLVHRASLGGGGGSLGGSGGGGAGGGGAPLPAIPASVEMTDAERNTLGLTMKYESHGRNTLNYVGKRQGLDPQTARGYTAQGYFQMLNSNWRRIAPRLGITAPNAMSGSLEEQTRVALHLLRNGGIGNWSRYNPALRGALARGERFKPTVPADEPHLVRGLDGVEGLDLNNGTMRMPDGSIRSITKTGLTIPDAPAGGFGGGGRGGDHARWEAVADRMHGAAERFENASFHGQIDLVGHNGVRARSMRIKSTGAVSADMGISMPGAKESDGDWM